MLEGSPVHATVAASDLGRARAWYEEKLGIIPKQEEGSGLWYEFGGGTWLLVYQTDAAGTARNTVAGWTVQDIESVVDDMRSRGVVFEEYEFPGMKTEHGLLTVGGYKAAWFKDSEGNILELSQTS